MTDALREALKPFFEKWTTLYVAEGTLPAWVARDLTLDIIQDLAPILERARYQEALRLYKKVVGGHPLGTDPALILARDPAPFAAAIREGV